ncbi:MAG TPA: UDP-3-O-acyl-N-acetylglucosamine deacetylase [Candidatus Caenarcaniphilales bacterium]
MGIAPITASEAASVIQSPHQHTLKASFVQTGIGLHTGITTQVRVLPALPDQGRCFVRVDLGADPPVIPAQVAAVHQTTLSTELRHNGICVRTVEHLLAALGGLGVDNVRIEIDGPEVPLLDGSAQPWVTAILQAGLVAQPAQRLIQRVSQPLWVQHQDAFVVALPASETRLSYGVDYNLPAIGRQWFSFHLSEFASAIAPARTFGFADQIEQLRASGLIKGGNLENALVCGPQGWLNPPLRFSDEPVRHKLLDLVGDLSLLGTLPQAHIVAYKASHTLHTELTQKLYQHGAKAIG